MAYLLTVVLATEENFPAYLATLKFFHCAASDSLFGPLTEAGHLHISWTRGARPRMTQDRTRMLAVVPGPFATAHLPAAVRYFSGHELRVAGLPAKALVGERDLLDVVTTSGAHPTI